MQNPIKSCTKFYTSLFLSDYCFDNWINYSFLTLRDLDIAVIQILYSISRVALAIENRTFYGDGK
jgi:hypothetical protein